VIGLRCRVFGSEVACGRNPVIPAPNGVDPPAAARHGRRQKKDHHLEREPVSAPVVAAGSVEFGNDLPISIIAGPCQLESRAHALEVASALKEIASRLASASSTRPRSTRPTAPAFRPRAASV